MSEQNPNLNPEQQDEEQSAPYTPAGFEKRTAAWLGIVYMLMLLFITTYSIYTGGGTLAGTFPLFLVPLAVGVIVIAVYRQRRGTAPGGLPLTILLVVVCACAAVFGLLLGVPALIAALQTPFSA